MRITPLFSCCCSARSRSIALVELGTGAESGESPARARILSRLASLAAMVAAESAILARYGTIQMARKRQRGLDGSETNRRSLSSGARPSTASVYYDRFAAKALQSFDKPKREKTDSIDRIHPKKPSKPSMEIVKRPKRSPREVPLPCLFHNVIVYLNKDGQVITREKVEDQTGLPVIKRRKRNANVVEDMKAVWVLMDPVTLEEELRENTRIFIPKGALNYCETTPGFRSAVIPLNPSLKTVRISLSKHCLTPLLVVDKKRIVGTVLFTEKQKVVVKWQEQEVGLSQWDVFQFDEGQEFVLANTSSKTVARVEILEVC